LTTATNAPIKANAQAWYQPIISPEHGVYVVLFASFFVGVALAGQWNWATTLALICAFFGFQAEHPLVLQIKQRKSWKPRFLVWGGVYGGTALGLATYLCFIQSNALFPLLAIYSSAGLALLVDAVAVFRRGQKSLVNEMVTFAAVCLAVPFAYIVTANSFTPTVVSFWALCTLYFSGTIFSVKLRKVKDNEALRAAFKRFAVYHAIALLVILTLYLTGWLPLIPALAFTVLLLKALFITIRLPWYRTVTITRVATLETASSLLFAITVIISLLPAKL
jgi:hypothetical protein